MQQKIDDILKQPYRLRGKDISLLLRQTKLTNREVTEIMGMNRSTFSRWKKDKQKISARSELLFRIIINTFAKNPVSNIDLLKLNFYTY